MPPDMKKIHPVHRSVIVMIMLWMSPLPVAFAQEVDHIYLKSGSVIRGNILEIEPQDHVKIEDLCGNIWYYPLTEVQKITSEPYRSPRSLAREQQEFDKGFVNMTSIGFLAGSSDNSKVAPFSLVMVNGYRNSAGIFTGAGIGIEFLSTNYMPLFVDLRYDLLGSDVVPYLVVRGGYAVPLTSDRSEYDIDYTYEGGPLLAAGAGLKIKTRSHFAWDIALMYRYQKTGYHESYQWNSQQYDYTDVYNRIEIRAGFYID
jgi:hypothetical protein